MNFWDFIGFLFWGYVIFSFLGILIGLFFDVFRDSSLSGWGKAGWIVFLVVFPILASVVYLVARGGKMGERQRQYTREARAHADDYIRSVATTSPADEIVKARALLDSGSITADEFETLKSRVLVQAPAHV